MRSLVPILWLGCALASFAASEPIRVEVDFARTNGQFRPLHGINKGPLLPGGLGDLTELQRALGIPFTRLHDCHWPNPNVVDIHAVFPDFRADPELPESYEFRLTDEYIAAVLKTGAQVVYRLGESIEHTSIKRFVHPPKDPEKWAAICLGIVRHYNEGWAKGFRHGIRYWEIWNEPENRPVMWTGSDEEFLRLYRTAAGAIKKRYPMLQVGGPGFGYTGQFVGREFKPSPFVTAFLTHCRKESVPLDFFSWHCYSDRPGELADRARAIRQLLDAHGFKNTESHLNEWNYLPDNSWEGLSRAASGEVRQRFYERMGGAEGAAFVVAALLQLQDAPVDVCNLFHGEAGGFGLFNEHGVPLKVFHGVRAFRELLDTPRRVAAQSAHTQATVGGGLNGSGTGGALILSWTGSSSADFRIEVRNIPWKGATSWQLRLLDSAHNLEPAQPTTNDGPERQRSLSFKGPGVALLQLRPVEPPR